MWNIHHQEFCPIKTIKAVPREGSESKINK
jgi:hypothetical protein